MYRLKNQLSQLQQKFSGVKDASETKEKSKLTKSERAAFIRSLIEKKILDSTNSFLFSNSSAKFINVESTDEDFVRHVVSAIRKNQTPYKTIILCIEHTKGAANCNQLKIITAKVLTKMLASLCEMPTSYRSDANTFKQIASKLKEYIAHTLSLIHI